VLLTLVVALGHRREDLSPIADGVTVEAGDSTEAPSNPRAIAPALLQVAAEAFDVGSAYLEDADAVLPAPDGELAEVERIRLSGESAVSARKPPSARRSESLNVGSETTMAVGGIMVVMSYLRVELRPRAGADRGPALMRETHGRSACSSKLDDPAVQVTRAIPPNTRSSAFVQAMPWSQT
jgi:hypothetical protein